MLERADKEITAVLVLHSVFTHKFQYLSDKLPICLRVDSSLSC